jgi:hypothetical protein
MLIFKDKLNNIRYITSKTLKQKLITLSGKNFNNENPEKYDNESLTDFFDKIGTSTPKILDYDKIHELISSKLNDSELEDFLPIFNMERVHFLSIIYLLSENLVTPKEIKNIIYMPFYSRTEYLLRYLSRETTETLKIDALLNGFFKAIKNTAENNYSETETYLPGELKIPELKRSLKNPEELFPIINSEEMNNYLSSEDRNWFLGLSPNSNISYNIKLFFGMFFNIELPKFVGELFRNRFNTNTKQSDTLMNKDNIKEQIYENTINILKRMSSLDDDSIYNINKRYLDSLYKAYTTDMAQDDFDNTTIQMTINSIEDILINPNEAPLTSLLEKIFPSIPENITIDSSLYFQEYFSNERQGYNYIRKNSDNLEKLKSLNMKIDNRDTITLDNTYYDNIKHYKVSFISEHYIQKFKEVLYTTMQENAISFLDLQEDNLTGDQVKDHINLLIDILPDIETNILAIEDEDIAISLLFYTDMFKKYLLYIVDTFNETSNGITYKMITYVSSNLYKQYKVINFVQQTFAITKYLYDYLVIDRVTNIIVKILNYDMKTLELGPPTSGNSTPGGGGSNLELQDFSVLE